MLKVNGDRRNSKYFLLRQVEGKDAGSGSRHDMYNDWLYGILAQYEAAIALARKLYKVLEKHGVVTKSPFKEAEDEPQ